MNSLINRWLRSIMLILFSALTKLKRIKYILHFTMEIDDESSINVCVFRDVLGTCSLIKTMVPKNYQWHKTIQFKDVVWRGMVIFIRQFIQNLKNNVITIMVTVHIHQEKK